MATETNDLNDLTRALELIHGKLCTLQHSAAAAMARRVHQALQYAPPIVAYEGEPEAAELDPEAARKLAVDTAVDTLDHLNTPPQPA
jgi:hypothetical protein